MRGQTAARWRGIGHVAAEHLDAAGLDRAWRRRRGQQGRLADAVGADQADQLRPAGIVERRRRRGHGATVAVRDARDVRRREVDRRSPRRARGLQRGRPRDVPGRAGHRPRPAGRSRTSAACAAAASGSTRTLTRNISLSRSDRVSTVFGVNCASAATNVTLAGIGAAGQASSTMRASAPSLDAARLGGRQEDVHVDVAASSMVNTLPPAGSTSPTLASRYWMRPSRGATSVLSAMLTRTGRRRAVAPSSACSATRIRAAAAAWAAVAASSCDCRWSSGCLAGVALLDQELRARSSSWPASRIWLAWIWSRSARAACKRLLRLADRRLGVAERGLEVARVHAGHDLAGLHEVALVGQQLGDAARELGARRRSRPPRAGRSRSRCPPAGPAGRAATSTSRRPPRAPAAGPGVRGADAAPAGERRQGRARAGAPPPAPRPWRAEPAPGSAGLDVVSTSAMRAVRSGGTDP